MPIEEPMKIITDFYKIKKIFFWLRGAPLILGALGPGLAGLCLKTALPSARSCCSPFYILHKHNYFCSVNFLFGVLFDLVLSISRSVSLCCVPVFFTVLSFLHWTSLTVPCCSIFFWLFSPVLSVLFRCSSSIPLCSGGTSFKFFKGKPKLELFPHLFS